MGWTELFALITFGVAGAGSPGPNNALLLASGVRFGFRRTVPHVVGAAAGVGALVLSVATGVGIVFDAIPSAQLGLKVIGSIYLLYLALRVASSRTIERTSVSKPLNAWEAALFQFVNPKAWIFAIAVVAAFLPPALPSLLGGLLLTTILTFVMLATSASWAFGGAALSKLVASERSVYLLNWILAILLVASVTFLWI
jgi:threonine/homoserine/homoserine lactone efflux protein